MKFILKIAAGLCFTGLLSFGSIIGAHSYSDGTVSTVSLSDFSAYGNNMGPMVITVNFGSGSSTCDWVAATAGCEVDNQFRIGYNPGDADTYPTTTPDGYWYIENLRGSADGTDNNIFSLTINTLAGNVALDRCMSGPNFNDNNNTLQADCSGQGTLGSSQGWTANDGPDGDFIVANAAYTNRLQTATENVGDLYGFMTLTFNQAQTTFDPGDCFSWRMDTDLLDPQVVPEPATLGLVGMALMGVGIFRRKKRPASGR